jgi:predicted N-acetyltransferase YhbS
LLARLAVDKHEKGAGLGKAFLEDALARIAQAADIVGARAVIVHAIDAQARTFYEHFDFEASPSHELHPMLLMKDLRKGDGSNGADSCAQTGRLAGLHYSERS